MKDFEIYLMGDQPTTCPRCGVRTEMMDYSIGISAKSKYHTCLSNDCKYIFILEEDEDTMHRIFA